MDGFLQYSDAAWAQKKRETEIATAIAKDLNNEPLLRRAGSVLNISRDGYYDASRFLTDTEKACDIMDANYNGEYKLAILMDHSPIHEAMAEDELNAKKMNVRPGGKQPIMKDGYFMRDGEKVTTMRNA